MSTVRISRRSRRARRPRASDVRRRGRVLGGAEPARPGGRARQSDAGQFGRQGRLRGGRRVPARVCGVAGVRRLAPRLAPLRRRSALRAGRARARVRVGRGTRPARARRREHSVGHWAERFLPRRRSREAARPVRLARTVPAAARRRAEAEVGRHRSGGRPSGPRRRAGRAPDAGRALPPRRPARPRVLDGVLFYLLLPWRVARELRAPGPTRCSSRACTRPSPSGSPARSRADGRR